MNNYYEILALSRDASQAEIQRNAKAKIAALKQQLQAGNGDERAIQREATSVKEAFTTLNDPAKRQAYDAELDARASPSPAAVEEIDPYQPPSAELEEEPDSVEGGNLDDAIQGNYEFSIMEVLREAWERTRGLKGAVWVATLALWGISILAGVLERAALMTLGSQPVGIVLAYGLQFGVTILSYPITAGIAMLGIYRAVDRDVMGNMAFSYFGFTLPLLIAGILIGFIVGAPIAAAVLMAEASNMLSLVLILPAIYLGFSYFYVFPLIVEKRLPVWTAMEASRKAVTTHWLQLFAVYFVMVLLVMLSVLPLGIGLVWTVPMIFALGGVLYRIIFGVGKPE